jgi:hypothetical protein
MVGKGGTKAPWVFGGDGEGEVKERVEQMAVWWAVDGGRWTVDGTGVARMTRGQREGGRVGSRAGYK